MAVSILSPVKTHIFIPACANLSMHSGTWQGEKNYFKADLDKGVKPHPIQLLLHMYSNERGNFIIGNSTSRRNLVLILSVRPESLGNWFRENNTSIMLQDTQPTFDSFFIGRTKHFLEYSTHPALKFVLNCSGTKKNQILLYRFYYFINPCISVCTN